MSVPVFIGNEASAAGYRLAGLRVRVPSDDDLLNTVHRACEQAALILISADVAGRIPRAELDKLLAGVKPAVVIVPDLLRRSAMPDLATRVRRQLGVLE